MTPTLPDIVLVPLLTVLGLVLGSFLNVCIHRLPLGESIVSPRSKCPTCGHTIPWYLNLPVLSWLALRGRCAWCRAPISWRYPFVEAFSALAVVGLYVGYGLTPSWAIASVFALAMIVLFFTDFDHQLLPDPVTLPGALAGVVLAWFNPFLGSGGARRLLLSAAGALLGAGVLWTIGTLYSRLRGMEAMGGGDIKMMAMVGAFSGPTGVLVTLLAGSVAGAVFGILMIPLRGRSLRDTLPFGCFLAPAAFVALLWGRPLLTTYLRLTRLGG